MPESIENIGVMKFDHGDYIPMLDALDQNLFQIGKDEMIKHKIIIAGITRDNAKEFLTMKENIEYIGSFFNDYKVVIFENDSKDGTKQNLYNWQDENLKIKIISKDFNNQKRPNIKFLANSRNFYLEEIEKNQYNDFDLVMMIDMDMPKGYDIRAIQAPFATINSWDVSCSNGIGNLKGGMYDAFAFRTEEFPYPPAEWTSACSNKNNLLTACQNISYNGRSIYWNHIVKQIQRIYPANDGLIEADSCFGGMALYKKKFLENCKYNSISDDCEHVIFNKCLKQKNNARIYMNSAQIINIHYNQ